MAFRPEMFILLFAIPPPPEDGRSRRTHGRSQKDESGAAASLFEVGKAELVPVEERLGKIQSSRFDADPAEKSLTVPRPGRPLPKPSIHGCQRRRGCHPQSAEGTNVPLGRNFFVHSNLEKATPLAPRSSCVLLPNRFLRTRQNYGC